MTDSLFGVSDKALKLCEQRAIVISNNIVNSATPNYKSRDMSFHQILQDTNTNADTLNTTDPGHIQNSNFDSTAKLQYRIPTKENLDGNTVDEEIERKNFLQNAMNYQINLTYVKNTTDKLLKAIKGE